MKKSFKIIILITVMFIAIILTSGIYYYLNRPSEMVFLPQVPCDIDWDGDCDESDFIMANLSIGKCLGDRYYERFADVNRDDCVTEDEVQRSFLETGPETYCDSNNDCWCGAFTGSQFILGERGPSLCNLEKNHCITCLYE